MMRTLALSLLSFALIAPGALAQATWSQLSPAASPPGCAGMQAVSDGANLFFFGGNLGSRVMSDRIWSFDGTTWSDASPASGSTPPGRDWYAAAWDGQNMVVFGGRDTNNADLGDTWTWDGNSWTQHTPATSPSPRRWASMAYDTRRNQCILFGGFEQATGQYKGDTWAWDGARWTLLAPGTSIAPARGRGKTAYNPATAEILYYGGRDASTRFGETWIWNGSDWRQVTTATTPSGSAGNGLFAFTMVYDEFRDRFVIFGGTENGPTLGDTWEFDGSDWTNRGNPSGVTGRTVPTMAYVSSLKKSFLFGGFSSTQLTDTWEYATSSPAALTYAGSGCAGSSGTPQMGNEGLPWIGDSFDVLVAQAGTAPTIFFFGLSDQSWLGTTLPLDLGILNAPGCTLYIALDIPVPDPMPTAGVARWTLAIPEMPAIAGLQFFLQGMVMDSGANLLGWVFSDYGTATIGLR